MEQEALLSFRLKAIADKIQQTGDAAFASYGLTASQVRFIRFINENGGTMTQKDLEQAAGVSHPTVAGIVSRLSDHGFVSVRTDEHDRRKKVLSLTEKAGQAGRELRCKEIALNGTLFHGLSPGEMNEFSRILEIIETNLNTALESGEGGTADEQKTK